mgnify:CR=1 FL=1
MQLDWLLQPLLAQLNTGVLVLNDQHQIVFFNQFIEQQKNDEEFYFVPFYIHYY